MISRIDTTNNTSHVMKLKINWLTAVLASICVAICHGHPINANESLRPIMIDVSQQIARFLKGQDDREIAVGSFSGPSAAVASSGPAMSLVLIDELQKQGVEVRRNARLEIKGDYRNIEQKDDGLQVLRIRVQVLDRAGEVLLELDKRIHDRSVLAQLLGMNKPDLGAGLTPERESSMLVSLIEAPSVFMSESRVTTSPQSPYRMEILVRSGKDFVPRSPRLEDGLPFISLDRGEVFAIRIINESEHSAAVEISLDGLSVFAFSENKSYRHFIVSPRSEGIIKGWHRTNQKSDEFVISRYAEGAVAELLQSADQVGTITASFAAAWRPQDKPPQDEGSQFRDPFGNAIGRGQPVQTPVQEVRMLRGRIRDVISVRYQRPEAR